jgi:hypothetical protein
VRNGSQSTGILLGLQITLVRLLGSHPLLIKHDGEGLEVIEVIRSLANHELLDLKLETIVEHGDKDVLSHHPASKTSSSNCLTYWQTEPVCQTTLASLFWAFCLACKSAHLRQKFCWKSFQLTRWSGTSSSLSMICNWMHFQVAVLSVQSCNAHQIWI